MGPDKRNWVKWEPNLRKVDRRIGGRERGKMQTRYKAQFMRNFLLHITTKTRPNDIKGSTLGLF